MYTVSRQKKSSRQASLIARMDRLRRQTVVGGAFAIVSLGAIGWSSCLHADDLVVSDEERRALSMHSQALKQTNDAYRALANVVEPSVVYVSVLGDPRSARREQPGRRMTPQELPDEFREFFEDQFGPDFFERRENNRQEREEEDEDLSQYDQLVPMGSGSGWVWEDGYIVTNNHVVENGEVVEVVFVDGSKSTAKVVGTDDKTDIAVLQVDRDDLTPFERADSEVQQGDLVFAFGSPFRYRFSMSSGIVSGVGRDVGILGNTGYEDFIQTDAAINPGNSGGPLVNVFGQVVGMNTAIATQTGQFAGIGFAIPMDMINDIVPQLIDGGEVVRGFIGAMIDSTPETVASFGVDEGVVVSDLLAGGPASKSDLQVGDVVTHIDGDKVTTASELRATVARIRPGKTAKFTVVREGDEKTVQVKVGRLSDDAMATASGGQAEEEKVREIKALEKLGISEVETFDEAIAEQRGWDHEPGVIISEVRPGSVAALRGLRRGQVITRVQNTPTPDVASLSRAMEDVDPEKGVRLRVRLDDDRSTFIVLKLAAY